VGDSRDGDCDDRGRAEENSHTHPVSPVGQLPLAYRQSQSAFSSSILANSSHRVGEVVAPVELESRVRGYLRHDEVNRSLISGGGFSMLRMAIIFLVISLVAGAFGFINISEIARRISLILFALFFIGFLILLGFALLVADAVSAPVVAALIE
jgi:uncharacterized membrane protein YtjA (UPF0391 family)